MKIRLINLFSCDFGRAVRLPAASRIASTTGDGQLAAALRAGLPGMIHNTIFIKQEIPAHDEQVQRVNQFRNSRL